MALANILSRYVRLVLTVMLELAAASFREYPSGQRGFRRRQLEQDANVAGKIFADLE